MTAEHAVVHAAEHKLFDKLIEIINLHNPHISEIKLSGFFSAYRGVE